MSGDAVLNGERRADAPDDSPLTQVAVTSAREWMATTPAPSRYDLGAQLSGNRERFQQPTDGRRRSGRQRHKLEAHSGTALASAPIDAFPDPSDLGIDRQRPFVFWEPKAQFDPVANLPEALGCHEDASGVDICDESGVCVLSAFDVYLDPQVYAT